MLALVPLEIVVEPALQGPEAVSNRGNQQAEPSGRDVRDFGAERVFV